MSLFSEEQPSLRTVTLAQLQTAFAEELADYLRQEWPDATLSDDSPRSVEFRRVWALEEVTLLERAAARLGCAIHLIPLPPLPKTAKPSFAESVPDREQAKRPGDATRASQKRRRDRQK